MTTLTSDQRNYYYLLAAERTGIHKPILAALYQAQGQPSLTDGETGLGVSPANRIPLEAVNTFAKQVQYAANTIRSLTGQLAAKGWTETELWNVQKGCYTDLFVRTVAAGYVPNATDSTTARLEACKPGALLQAYLKDLETELATPQLNLAYLEQSLLVFVQKIPYFYYGLPHQRDAMLEAVRIWHQLDTREESIASLEVGENSNLDESRLDIILKKFIQGVSQTYAGYPYQREALIRLTQLWRQSPSRQVAIASLEKSASPELDLKVLDPALIAFMQHLPQSYISSGFQRHALTETFQLWRQLDSRTAALEALGISTESVIGSKMDKTQLANIASLLNQELLQFIRRMPGEYKELDYQREASIRLVQLWRNITTREQTIQSLFDDLKLMELGNRDRGDAPLRAIALRRPKQWTMENIQLSTSIIVDGNFTWAEATHGGMWMPPNQETVDAIVRIASLAQRACDRIARPLLVIGWYLPPHINRAVGNASYSRYTIGDALDFSCDGLSGNQLYWFLDPWWPGGLGRYTQFPYLCHIDARSYRARWKQ